MRGRRAERDGVGAQHGHGAARGHHDDAVGAAGDQPDHAALHRNARIDAGRAKVMRVAYRHRAHPVFQGLVHGQVHGLRGHRIPQPAHAVDQRAGAAVAHHLRTRVQPQRTGAPFFLVGRQHRNAMRIDAQQIRLRHQAGGGVRQVLIHAPRLQHLQDLFAHLLYRHVPGCCSVALHWFVSV
ncbi:hypothetical protein D3C77_542520 [compost metagenome]